MQGTIKLFNAQGTERISLLRAPTLVSLNRNLQPQDIVFSPFGQAFTTIVLNLQLYNTLKIHAYDTQVFSLKLVKTTAITVVQVSPIRELPISSTTSFSRIVHCLPLASLKVLLRIGDSHGLTKV